MSITRNIRFSLSFFIGFLILGCNDPQKEDYLFDKELIVGNWELEGINVRKYLRDTICSERTILIPGELINITSRSIRIFRYPFYYIDNSNYFVQNEEIIFNKNERVFKGEINLVNPDTLILTEEIQVSSFIRTNDCVGKVNVEAEYLYVRNHDDLTLDKLEEEKVSRLNLSKKWFFNKTVKDLKIDGYGTIQFSDYDVEESSDIEFLESLDLSNNETYSICQDRLTYFYGDDRIDYFIFFLSEYSLILIPAIGGGCEGTAFLYETASNRTNSR